MAAAGVAVAEAARALVGARFRLHGRDPRFGLDCVGVAACALRGGGHAGLVPEGYALRGGSAEGWAARLDAAGLARVDEGAPGDVVLLATGPGQFHLAVLTAQGFVHADAGLRRVVEVPGRPGWPVIGAWRVGGEDCASCPTPHPQPLP